MNENGIYSRKTVAGGLERKLTGCPSIDKPWLKYYSEEAVNAPLPEGSMYEYLWECNKECLDDVALIYFDNKISYRELFKQIDRISSALAAYGIKSGDMVSIISLNTPETVCVFYALNKLGAVACMEYVTQTPGLLADSLNSVSAKIVFVLDMFFPQYEAVLRKSDVAHIVLLPLSASMGQPFKLLSSLKKIKFPDNERFVRFSLFLKSKMTSRVTTSHGGMTEAVILSTSGTTGIPKKVVHSSFGINSIIFQYQTSGMVFKRGEIYISMAPLFLAFGVTLAIHLPLCAGVTSVICLDPDAKKSIKMFAKYRPNHFLCGDYHMLEMISNHAVKKMNLSFLRTIAIGGESLSVENLVKVNKFLKKHFSPVSLITGYGMTELGATAVTEMNDVRKIGTVGIPQNKVTVKVVDTENGKEKTYDETGEILINAPGMMMGYLNQPQETENSVEVDIMGKKWIHTGDLGKIDKDGFVYIQGRLKRIYRRLLPESGVFKVFPDYIEKTLDKHPAVKHCAVICVEDKTFITAPVAFIVLSQQVENPEKIFSEYIESEIGEYNVPVRYVLKKDMPLLANGKIDYCTLEQEVDIEEKV